MMLSLDEIIARQKKTGRGNDSAMGYSNRRFGQNYAGKYESGDSAFTKTASVGKWSSKGFGRKYEGSGPYSRHNQIDRSPMGKKVKILINNLAPSVTTEDLVELFADYGIDSANVHFDEVGESVGSGDVLIDRANANELMKNFRGLALDGKKLQMFLIDESNSFAVAKKKNMKDRLTGFKSQASGSKLRGITKRTGIQNNNVRKGKQAAKDPRKQLTAEDLDRELDEYMKKGNRTSKAKMES